MLRKDGQSCSVLESMHAALDVCDYLKIRVSYKGVIRVLLNLRKGIRLCVRAHISYIPRCNHCTRPCRNAYTDSTILINLRNFEWPLVLIVTVFTIGHI